MASSSTFEQSKLLVNTSSIPIVVCEFHQEVLEYIHRYVARKKLPFSRLLMIHFDAHPDLAYPNELNADDCYSKEKMYNDLEIADWILPLMYMKHLDRLLWVKPEWARQIDDIETKFYIGKEKKTGKLRVTCSEDYFLEDCSYTLKENLENASQVQLKVLTMASSTKQNITDIKTHSSSLHNTDGTEQRHLCKNLDTESKAIKRKTNLNEEFDSNSKTRKIDNNSDKNSPTCPLDNKKESFCLPSLNEKYILDIDLDFFSVTNPFKKDFTEDEYSLLKDIYRLDLPEDKDKDSLQAFVFQTGEKYSRIRKLIQGFSQGTICNSSKDLMRLLKMIKTRRIHENIDGLMIHEAGITTDLPHHISTCEEINGLIHNMESFLKTLPAPTIVTMARSTLDEYCPPEQIDIIQEKVLTLLKSIYDNVDIIYDYKDTSRYL